MNFDQIMALVNAGYTKADIDAMQTAAPEQTPAPEQPEQTPTPAPAPTPAPTPEQPADNYSRLESLLKQFINTAQTGNINADLSGTAPQARSASDILGAVIAPSKKGE